MNIQSIQFEFVPLKLRTLHAPLAMAASSRIARTLSASSLSNLINKSTVENSPIYFTRRWAHSSSSPDSSTSSSKPKSKKITDRLSSVIDAVNDRKLPPELRGQRNTVRSETDIMNVVEQRIWHSMEEGQFEKLPGKGKPLNLNTNPHADPGEDTLYRILSKNGCAPEWIELNKEIRGMVSEWRIELKRAWKCKCNGDHPKWMESSELLKAKLRDINDKVFRYNLIVPFGQQIFGLKWEKELDRIQE